MDALSIAASPTTPKVQFDHQSGWLELSGKSLPENAPDFFAPIMKWMDAFIAIAPFETRLIFKLEYFNTSSTSQFLKLIRRLEKLSEQGKVVSVTWYYDHEDDDMREAGEDFRYLSKIPVEIIGTDFIGL
jgi:hypothetical protein